MELSFHFIERKEGVRHRGREARTESPSLPPSLLRPVTGRKEDGRPQPELRKRRKGRQVDFLLSKAGSRRGRSPRRHTYPARYPRRPRPALPCPAASRALPARPSGRCRKSDPWSCPQCLTSRPHSFSHRLVLQEEQDASSPGRAASGWDSSIASRDAATAA